VNGCAVAEKPFSILILVFQRCFLIKLTFFVGVRTSCRLVRINNDNPVMAVNNKVLAIINQNCRLWDTEHRWNTIAAGKDG
jgi:hypothetical protein